MDISEEFSIPAGYGDNRIVLMIRDPWTLFAYWEVTRAIEIKILDTVHRKGLIISKTLLRVCDVTEREFGKEKNAIRDFELKTWIDNWYVKDVTPGRKWMAAVGILCTTGEFFEFIRSNIVETPRCVFNESVCGMSSFGSSGYMSGYEI